MDTCHCSRAWTRRICPHPRHASASCTWWAREMRRYLHKPPPATSCAPINPRSWHLTPTAMLAAGSEIGLESGQTHSGDCSELVPTGGLDHGFVSGEIVAALLQSNGCI